MTTQKTIIKKIEVAKFEYLPEDIKQVVLDNHIQNYEPFLEDVKDDFTEICEMMGIHIKNIYWTGFYSQGDGACFEADFEYKAGCVEAVKEYAPKDKKLHDIVKKWQEVQSRYDYKIYGEIRHAGHYFHEFCTKIFVAYENIDGDEEQFYDEGCSRQSYNINSSNYQELTLFQKIDVIMRALCNWLYENLEKENDYYTSEEYIIIMDNFYNMETGEIEY